MYISNNADKRIPHRAGVIPYTTYNSKLYFLLGVDRSTRELTDFGGGKKATESMIEAALRELNEESCKIFDGIVTLEQLKFSPVVTTKDKTIAIFFVRVDPKWIDIAEKTFVENQQKFQDIKKYNELVGVKWVEQERFKLIAFDRRSHCMWKRIQNILRWNTTWSDLHITLLLSSELTSALHNSWNYFSNGLELVTRGILVR